MEKLSSDTGYFKKPVEINRRKSSQFTNPSFTQIETIDIGHKSLLIIIGP